MKTILLLTIIQISLCTSNSLLLQTGQDEQYCASNDGIRCHLCYVSFLTPNYKCQVPSIKVDRCLTYLNDNQCTSCQFNYQLVGNECRRNTIDRCAKQIQNHCQICGEGLLVNALGQCEIDSPCSDINCSYCTLNSGVDQCLICRSGYVLSGVTQDIHIKQICVRETTKTQNCLMLDQSQLQCQNCDLNYYMDNQRNCIKSKAYEIDLLGYGHNLFVSIMILLTLLF